MRMVGAWIESSELHKSQERRLYGLGVAVCFLDQATPASSFILGMFIILHSAY
jgi:hypothetical protein